MQEDTQALENRIPDDELTDVLIAISVVSKRLARKLQALKEEGGTAHGKNERAGAAG